MDAKVFVPIRVSTLRGDRKISFDAFVKVAGKYILYCRQGDSFEGERLSRLKKKNIRQMFIQNQDELNYRTYLQSNIDQAYDLSSQQPPHERAAVIQGVQQAAAEDVMEDPANETNYNNARFSAKRYVEYIMADTKAVQAIYGIQNVDNNIAHHGTAVATLALAIALEVGIKDQNQLNLLTLGCQIHDIEHFHTLQKLDLPITNMTPEEYAIYKQHPLKGAERLNKYSFFDQVVLKIILQHEEGINGGGFPKGLRKGDLEPLAMIAATANAYDRMVTFEKTPPKEAMKSLLINKMGILPLENLQALQRILKIQNLVS